MTRGAGRRAHLSELLDDDLADQPIRVAGHCFGCTAGQGSSCGGGIERGGGMTDTAVAELFGKPDTAAGRNCPVDYALFACGVRP